ncbi:hypothetical protein P167DRAFT_579844 [Morchella conica CCBAS932]|uniref:Uncharacterized protein n=1 Tax=Morchella conica CCBAS932 TaxID=1392247 RepID=A0A3N4KC66_9PEZI|nr:hypothetical protein P167DRAFT_579844 [Morchella conica CCBAS932]
MNLNAKGQDVRVYVETSIEDDSTACDLIKGDLRDEVLTTLVKKCEGITTLALKALTWLIPARCTYTVEALCMAISTGDGTRQLRGDLRVFNEADAPLPKTTQDACCGLVTIGDSSGAIRLAHYSVQEYLEHSPEIPE